MQRTPVWVDFWLNFLNRDLLKSQPLHAENTRVGEEYALEAKRVQLSQPLHAENTRVGCGMWVSLMVRFTLSQPLHAENTRVGW